MKRAFGRILLVLALAALTLAATEFLARVLFPRFADEEAYLDRALERLLNSTIRFDPQGENFSRKFGFVLSPNARTTRETGEYRYTSETNSLGFRSREIAPKRDGEYRVMLLGDSFFWGVGVEESDTVATKLERAGGAKLSVHNFAIVGYNTVQELIVARSYVDLVRPDHIVLGYFVGNDMISNAMTFIDENGNYATSDEMQDKVRRELKQRFGAFFRSVMFRIVALHLYVPRIRYQIATHEEVLARSYELLLELDALAQRAGAKFSVVLLYPRDAVEGGIVEAWSRSRRAGELIAAFCRSRSIPVLDLIGYMNTPEHKELYFFQQDGHPNAAGNDVIARAIFHDLVEPHLAR